MHIKLSIFLFTYFFSFDLVRFPYSAVVVTGFVWIMNVPLRALGNANTVNALNFFEQTNV